MEMKTFEIDDLDVNNQISGAAGVLSTSHKPDRNVGNKSDRNVGTKPNRNVGAIK